MTLETALGWWLAYTAHPLAAWRALGLQGRVALIGTYFGVGYVGVLAALLLA